MAFNQDRSVTTVQFVVERHRLKSCLGWGCFCVGSSHLLNFLHLSARYCSTSAESGNWSLPSPLKPSRPPHFRVHAPLQFLTSSGRKHNTRYNLVRWCNPPFPTAVYFFFFFFYDFLFFKVTLLLFSPSLSLLPSVSVSLSPSLS